MEENDDIENIKDIDESFIQENIRSADNAYVETLIEDNRFVNSDNDLELALRISSKEYNENRDNFIQYDDIHEQIIQDNDLELALELSNKEYIEQLERINQINMEQRKESLKNFCKRIKSLRFSDEEKELKEYFELRLQEYFELKIDCDIIDNRELFNKLFKYIDTLYLIPSKKDKNKTSISQEEDNILRTFFLYS